MPESPKHSPEAIAAYPDPKHEALGYATSSMAIAQRNAFDKGRESIQWQADQANQHYLRSLENSRAFLQQVADAFGVRTDEITTNFLESQGKLATTREALANCPVGGTKVGYYMADAILAAGIFNKEITVEQIVDAIQSMIDPHNNLMLYPADIEDMAQRLHAEWYPSN